MGLEDIFYFPLTNVDSAIRFRRGEDFGVRVAV